MTVPSGLCTHGGIHAFTVTDSGNRTAVARVAGDNVQFFYRLVRSILPLPELAGSGWRCVRHSDERRVFMARLYGRAYR